MMRALLAVLALCAAATAAAVEPRSWYALTTDSFSVEQENVLYKTCDFRGIYGHDNNVAIVVATETQATAVAKMLGVDAQMFYPYGGMAETLYVAEYDDVNPTKVLTLNARKLPMFVRTLSAARLLVYAAPYGEPLDIIEAELIPIPRRAIRKAPVAPKTKTASLDAANPTIVDALNAVSRDKLYATVNELSNNFHTRLSISDGADDAAEFLQDRLVDLGYEVSTFDFLPNYSTNVIVEIPGVVEPEHIVVAGAHYDSRSTDTSNTELRAPGADDNGSGTSAIMEIARILASGNYTFHYTVRLILFSGEEQGLLGSAAYAAEMADQDASIIAMFNADMLGYRIPGSQITLGMKDRYITEWLLSAATAAINLYVPSLGVEKSSSCCSDYKSFWDAGFPAIGFFENPTTASDYPDYHTSNDVIANLDFDQVRIETQALLATLMTFAVPV